MAEVLIIECKNYHDGNPQRTIEAAFNELNLRTLFKDGEKILLKPNLLSAKNPERAVTTHPQIFAGVAEQLIKYNLNLAYGDSPATDSPSKAAKTCGIEKEALKLGISPADFTGSYDFEFPQGRIAKRFKFVNAVRDNDGIISLCKFKTHALTRFTGAMKNQFGLIPGLLKAKDHVKYPNEKDFAGMLADLNMALKPRLYVMDAVIGMEGNGPAAGTPRQIGLILISTDPVALDSVCVTLMGLDNKQIPFIKAGKESGLGEADLSKIQIVCMTENESDYIVSRGIAEEMLKPMVLKDFKNSLPGKSSISLLNSFAAPLAKKVILNRPVIIQDNCIRCKKCVEVCPVEPKAIYFSKDKNKIKYHYEKCIRCFCCQETCPYDAIEVKKAPLGFLVK